MEEVDAEISEMKLFLNGRARFVAEGYLAQVLCSYDHNTNRVVHIACSPIVARDHILYTIKLFTI
jgi:ARP2/3 complex 20 kDa subunit (ARPC4)